MSGLENITNYYNRLENITNLLKASAILIQMALPVAMLLQ